MCRVYTTDKKYYLFYSVLQVYKCAQKPYSYRNSASRELNTIKMFHFLKKWTDCQRFSVYTSPKIKDRYCNIINICTSQYPVGFLGYISQFWMDPEVQDLNGQQGRLLHHYHYKYLYLSILWLPSSRYRPIWNVSLGQVSLWPTWPPPPWYHLRHLHGHLWWCA